MIRKSFRNHFGLDQNFALDDRAESTNAVLAFENVILFVLIDLGASGALRVSTAIGDQVLRSAAEKIGRVMSTACTISRTLRMIL